MGGLILTQTDKGDISPAKAHYKKPPEHVTSAFWQNTNHDPNLPSGDQVRWPFPALLILYLTFPQPHFSTICARYIDFLIFVPRFVDRGDTF